mgnify:CR=1 FL=1
MSSKSKAKGSRGERRIVSLLNIAGCNASRVPLSGALGGELSGDVWINGIVKRRLVAEVKSRRPSNIFWKKIKDNLDTNDMLFLLEDREEPLVVCKLSTFLEIADKQC